MIDLHTHTDESDGSFSPQQLMIAAAQANLEAIAITDHDTFAGFDEAARHAAAFPGELICGIELATRYRGRSVHLLGYFLDGVPDGAFRGWLNGVQKSRRERNERLIERLQGRGVDITLDDVRRHGKGLIGRPHFAAALVEKGYADSIQGAFKKYLDESGACFVPRNEPAFAEAVSRILEARGLPSLPHPGRVSTDYAALEESVCEMQRLGLRGIEAYHSDHSAADVDFYKSLAGKFSLAITGGSDFHGTAKPQIALGAGKNGNVRVPLKVLDRMKRYSGRS
ncbi:MAG: PHP domain-containing protein [Bryobacteraceae bacterium]